MMAFILGTIGILFVLGVIAIVIMANFEKIVESTYKTKEEKDCYRYSMNLLDYWNTGEMGKRDHDFKF